MAASVLFMTMLYGPVFTVIEAELPRHLKATATGINILALSILMIGGLAIAGRRPDCLHLAGLSLGRLSRWKTFQHTGPAAS
jgi:hypothetical protein